MTIHQATPLYDYYVSTLTINTILSIILTLLNPIQMQEKLKKHPDVTLPYTTENHLLAHIVPDNRILQVLLSIALCVGISTVGMMGIVGILGYQTLEVIPGAIIRAIDTAFDSTLVFYFATVFYSVRMSRIAKQAGSQA